jgi:hypothetical protein
MIWTDTKNMNGTVGWLKLTGEDDPIVTFFLSLKPDIININARKKFTFRDIDTKLQTVLSDLNIPPFAWSQFEYAANAWLIVRGKEDNANPPRLIASGTVSHATTLNKVFDIQPMLPCVPASPDGSANTTDTLSPATDYGLVIDDGLPFLNHAFTDATGGSKFKSVWIQSAQTTPQTNSILRVCKLRHLHILCSSPSRRKMQGKSLYGQLIGFQNRDRRPRGQIHDTAARREHMLETNRQFMADLMRVRQS